MAIALLGTSNSGNIAMRHSKTVLALTLFAALGASGAQAQSWTSSSNYNGYGGSNMNTASNYSLRDPNGNLTLVNGQFESASNYAPQSGSQSASAMTGGVGTSGAGSQYGQATAVGNQLNVVVLGSHNTTVVDTTQINNGNQTATVALNQ
jgi:holdfast attachment protein HfaA